MISAAKAQYLRRAQPAQSTGWCANDIHRYMKYQLHQYKTGALKRSSVGGFSWLLPKKGPDGRPAELPQEVLEFLGEEAARAAVAPSSGPVAPHGKKAGKVQPPPPEPKVKDIQYKLEAWS